MTQKNGLDEADKANGFDEANGLEEPSGLDEARARESLARRTVGLRTGEWA